MQMLLRMVVTELDSSHVQKMVLATRAAETSLSRMAEQMLMWKAEQMMS